MTYVEMIEDSQGDLVEIEYYCSAICYESDKGKSASGQAWPGGMETDYDVRCSRCADFMWKGLEA